MAISECCSCKAIPRRCYNRNRPQYSPLTFASAHGSLLLLMTLASMSTSCLALPLESTTLSAVEIEEATTVIPPQQPPIEASSTTPTTLSTVPAVNETTIVKIEPIETVAAEVADEFLHTSFVSLGGGGLEQGIRNAVKSEVESEIEADSSALVETMQQAEQTVNTENEQKSTSSNDELTVAAQNVREPKTLEAAQQAEAEQQAGAEQQVEAEQQAEEKAGAEQPAEAERPSNVAVPNNDELQAETETATDTSSVESQNRPLPSVTSDLVAVIFDENRAITEQPITKTNLLALKQEHEVQQVVETTLKPTYEVTKHQVTKKQGVQDLLPIELLPKENTEKQEESQPQPEPEPAPAPEIEVAQAPSENNRDQPTLETLAESTAEPSVQLNEIEENNIIESEDKVKELQPVVSSTAEPDYVEPTEAYFNVVEPVEAAAVESVQEESEPVPDASSSATTEATLSPTEVPEVIESQTEYGESIAADGETKTPESVKLSESNPIADLAQPDSAKEDNSSEDVSGSNSNSESAEKDSSEESAELSADEPLARADDSTATPLVSYPPHNAGQTFYNNLADERSAHLSLSSTNRSTLIIALCSGTAVIFIVISLVIFVLSFQRQHGTLDIEMQEQRLGKDNLDEEDAQMKLLDVELSTPVIIAMGNEETDECL